MSENELDSLMRQADMARKEEREESMDWSGEGKVSHTPGPWVERDCEIQAADGSPVCEMLARPEDEPKWGRDHADANSRLICAAPETKRQRDELLSVLREVDRFFRQNDDFTGGGEFPVPEFIVAAREAINSATKEEA